MSEHWFQNWSMKEVSHTAFYLEHFAETYYCLSPHWDWMKPRMGLQKAQKLAEWNTPARVLPSIQPTCLPPMNWTWKLRFETTYHLGNCGTALAYSPATYPMKHPPHLQTAKSTSYTPNAETTHISASTPSILHFLQITPSMLDNMNTNMLPEPSILSKYFKVQKWCLNAWNMPV